MANQLQSFDPIGSFQRSRSNALSIQGQEQDLALQPQRNELAQLKLSGEQATQSQQGTTFDQGQAVQRATILNQAARALGGINPEQRAQAFATIEPELVKFGIPAGTFTAEQLTDENLLNVIQGTQAFIKTGDPEQFTLSPGQTRFEGGREIASVAATVAPVAQVTDKERAETERIKAQTDEIRQKLAGGGNISATDIKVLEEEKKATVKVNVARIAELEQATKARTSSIKKAKQFKRQLETGERGSGTSRTVAGFFPGVFTDQAEFDQKFNAFAEVAARQQLKAAGEVRPTDADVEGMKRAMFGIGRDEPVNIQLLSEFISDQEDSDEELEALRDAKAAGVLSEFVGVTAANDQLSADLETKRARLDELRAKAAQ